MQLILAAMVPVTWQVGNMPLPPLRDDGNGFNASYATPADVAAKMNDPLATHNIAQQFLQKQGLPLTSDNMRRAMQANADNPGTIPGLVNNPPPAALPNSPMAAAGSQQGQSTGVGGMPIPPMPPPGGGNMPIPPIPPGANVPGSVENSTIPGGGGGPDLASVVGTAVLAGLPAIMQAFRGATGGGGGAQAMGNQPMPPTGRVMDVPGPAIAGGSQLSGLPAPQGAAPAQGALSAPGAAMPPGQGAIGGSTPMNLEGPPAQARIGMQPQVAGNAPIAMPPPQADTSKAIPLPQANGNDKAALRRQTHPKVPIPRGVRVR